MEQWLEKIALGAFQDELEKIAKGKAKSKFQALEKNRVPLSPEERDLVMKRKATWNHGPNGEPTPAVWKSVRDGGATFVTATHRAYNISPSIKGAINRYHRFIKGTS